MLIKLQWRCSFRSFNL